MQQSGKEPGSHLKADRGQAKSSSPSATFLNYVFSSRYQSGPHRSQPQSPPLHSRVHRPPILGAFLYLLCLYL